MTSGTRALDRTWAVGAVLLGIPVVPLTLWCGYWSWLYWNVGDRWVAVTMGAIPVAWVGATVAFAIAYHRWQRRKALL